MNIAEYAQFDGVSLAALVAKGEVSPAELAEAAIERAERHNGTLNAIVYKAYDEARAAAAGDLPAGPFRGVPFLIKDLGMAVAGWPRSSGSRFTHNAVDEADGSLVARYRASGAILLGKTNTPEFGLEPVTEPEMFGPTLNPWNVARTPGGSSGGAASAVAAGLVPAAHASDGGGSIRIPASCCGLFGLKPSRGRVSFAPADEGWGGFSAQHAVTRTVRDSAALLDIACRPAPGDPYWLDPPASPFATEVGREPGILRIGFTTAALCAEALDPSCAQAVRDAASLCASLGHHVEEATLPGNPERLPAVTGAIVAASVAAALEGEAAQRGRAIEEGEIEAFTWSLYQRGRAVSGPAYIQALRTAHAFGREVAPFFERFDVLLLATLGSPPIASGALRGEPPDPRGYAERLFAFMPNTQAFNVTGQPAMSVPLAWTADGLPVGVQFVGRPAAEATLFRLAAQLEAAQPWGGRRPPAPFG